MTTNKEKLIHPVVKAAIESLESGDARAWFTLFIANAELYDDGNKQDFQRFSNSVFTGVMNISPVLIRSKITGWIFMGIIIPINGEILKLTTNFTLIRKEK